MVDYAEGKNGPTPTIREISQAFGLAYTTTYTHVLKLIRDGRVMQSDGKLVVIDSEWIPPPA
jgi:DNA-binding IclR family transcriptional regulator